MEEKVSIVISNRHVHLTEESINTLFGHSLHVKRNLNQVGYYAAEEVVSIEANGKVIDNVRVVGPARSYNQVEISASDARKLGIHPPVRKSGDVVGSSVVTIKTSLGSITGEFCIIIDRHVHMNPVDAKKLGVQNGEVLTLSIGGDKPGEVLVNAKVSDDGYFEVHLDIDDANAFLINDGDEGILSK